MNYDDDNFTDWYEQQDKDKLFKEYLLSKQKKVSPCGEVEIYNAVCALVVKDLTYDDFQSWCFEQFQEEGRDYADYLYEMERDRELEE